MKPTTLVQRYTYGNFSDLPSFGPEADLLHGMAARQQELVVLARAQIDVQERTSRALAASNIAAAGVIRKEVETQTEQLRSEIQRGSNAIVDAVSYYGARIAGELTEIGWELIQLRGVSEQILQVLRRPRSTEAQELLSQGVRNLVNDKIEQAEERFRLALERDNTDYQVLMNLSAVDMRKGNPQGAVAFAKDALTLPQDLDTRARADALWHLARIHYATEDYGEAFDVGQESVALIAEPRRTLQVGIYAMLAGNLSAGIPLIADAVRSDPALFALAASTPDLSEHREQVHAMLADLASEQIKRFRIYRDQFPSELSAVDQLENIDSFYKVRYREMVASLVEFESEPTYSECCYVTPKMSALLHGPMDLKRLDQATLALRECSEAEAAAASELEAAKAKLSALPKRPGCSATLIGVGVYVILSLLVYGFVLPALNSGRAGNPAISAILMVVIYGSPFLIGIPRYRRLKRMEGEVRAACSAAEERLPKSREELGIARREHAECETSVGRILGGIRQNAAPQRP